MKWYFWIITTKNPEQMTENKLLNSNLQVLFVYRGADKSLAQPGRKQATLKEDFDLHIP
jgi:hypothetical protein